MGRMTSHILWKNKKNPNHQPVVVVVVVFSLSLSLSQESHYSMLGPLIGKGLHQKERGNRQQIMSTLD